MKLRNIKRRTMAAVGSATRLSERFRVELDLLPKMNLAEWSRSPSVSARLQKALRDFAVDARKAGGRRR